ncbi:MAG: PQQ-binding-like beta-propeller repeat protein [Bryobacteraceae bacterium]
MLPLAGVAQVTTSQYDNARTGANLKETKLTPRNVNVRQFGKLFSFHVDGDVYAQPLFLNNVVFIATEHDSVYAFDAAGKSLSPLWKTSFIDPQKGISTVPAENVNCPFISPEVGITSTPVIDASTRTIYVLARTKERDSSGSARFWQRLHALDVLTGAEKLGGQVVIQASVSSPKGGFFGLFPAPIDFLALHENPRASLLLSDGKIYLTWASSCDVGPYHGWIIAYDAHTLKQLGAFNTSPDSLESGIWQSDTGPTADEDGNVFVATGNGRFDALGGGRDYGDSVLKVGFTRAGLAVKDYFTPFNQEELNATDGDLGSGGPLLIPQQPGSKARLLVVGGKGAVIYVIDRDRMGRFREGSDRHAVETIKVGGAIMSAPAYWNGHIYYFPSDDVLKDFAIQNGRLSAQPVAKGSTNFDDPGATPSISANGAKDGIVWVIETKGWNSNDRAAVLRAYDAENVANEIYDSNQNIQRDGADIARRFTIPTVADGRVYVGTSGEVDVYGLLPVRRASSRSPRAAQ